MPRIRLASDIDNNFLVTQMTKQNFRILVVLEWLIIISGLVVYFLTKAALPSEVREYLENQNSAPLTTADMIFFCVSVVLILLTIVTSIGLFFFKRWSKTLLLLSYVVTILLTPTHTVYINTGWTELLFTVGDILGGMILALVYFSPISTAFEAPPDIEESFPYSHHPTGQ
jgi:hypothetical protein